MLRNSVRQLEERRERGATLVEFALVMPVFFMMVLGMFSGGQSYDRKLRLTNGAREASRYGATLPVSNFSAPFTAPATTSLQAWLVSVADAAVQNAEGTLNSSVSGREVCVAYVYPTGTAATPNDRTTRLVRNTTQTFSNSTCFTDNRPATERRVQVQLRRPGRIQGLFFVINLNLRSETLTRFEAATT